LRKKKRKKPSRWDDFSFLKYVDNNDTVSKGFTGFHFSALWFHFSLREMKP